MAHQEKSNKNVKKVATKAPKVHGAFKGTAFTTGAGQATVTTIDQNELRKIRSVSGQPRRTFGGDGHRAGYCGYSRVLHQQS